MTRTSALSQLDYKRACKTASRHQLSVKTRTTIRRTSAAYTNHRMNFSGQCPVCYQDWRSMEVFVGIIRNNHPGCKTHLFCTQCYATSAQVGRAGTCPFDRRPFIPMVPSYLEIMEVTATIVEEPEPSSPAAESSPMDSDETSAPATSANEDAAASDSSSSDESNAAARRRPGPRRKIRQINRTPRFLGATTCGVCGKEFSNRGTKSKHEARHGPPRFMCAECAAQFYTVSDLNRHMKVHQPTAA